MVILTHPRNLTEPDVMATTSAVSSETHAGTRLFAVSVDSRGQLELAELRRGLPIVLARSRIELEPKAASPTLDITTSGPRNRRAWKRRIRADRVPVLLRSARRARATGASGGDLMSRSFDFDESGERILALGVGLGHLLFTRQARRDGSRALADAGVR